MSGEDEAKVLCSATFELATGVKEEDGFFCNVKAKERFDPLTDSEDNWERVGTIVTDTPSVRNSGNETPKRVAKRRAIKRNQVTSTLAPAPMSVDDEVDAGKEKAGDESDVHTTAAGDKGNADVSVQATPSKRIAKRKKKTDRRSIEEGKQFVERQNQLRSPPHLRKSNDSAKEEREERAERRRSIEKNPMDTEPKGEKRIAKRKGSKQKDTNVQKKQGGRPKQEEHVSEVDEAREEEPKPSKVVATANKGKRRKGGGVAKGEDGAYYLAYAMWGHATNWRNRIYRVFFHPTEDYVVATIENNVLCIIDIEEREVLKKYVHPPEYGEESFSTLAWSQLDDKANSIVIAAGGGQRDIKLFDVENMELYDVLVGHSSTITSLCFSPSNPRWLLSGAESPEIYLWDIPSPTGNGAQASKCLAKFSTKHLKFTSDVAFNPIDGYQFVAGGKRRRAKKNQKKRGVVAKWTISGDIEKEYDQEEATVTVSDESASMYPIEKIVETVGWLPNNVVVAKEMYADDIMVLNLEEEGKHLVPLQHASAKTAWFMKMSMNEAHTRLLMGTDTGDVRMYDVSKLTKKRGPKIAPIQVLSHDDLYGKVPYGVAISRDHKYIVCGTDENLLMVWQKSEN